MDKSQQFALFLYRIFGESLLGSKTPQSESLGNEASNEILAEQTEAFWDLFNRCLSNDPLFSQEGSESELLRDLVSDKESTVDDPSLDSVSLGSDHPSVVEDSQSSLFSEMNILSLLKSFHMFKSGEEDEGSDVEEDLESRRLRADGLFAERE